MCASVLESADGLRKNLGAKKVFKIITELESGKIIIIIELDKKRFYSFVLDKESKIDEIINNLDQYNQKLIGAY
jgi:predicted regulator of Ras-like GTPase activity (Roadblock/LC7/MglB family)